MLRTGLFVLISYLSGSVLYANLFGSLFGKKDLYLNSADQNPGTANAFTYGGFWCGALTLVCDLLKGFLPVSLYLQTAPSPDQFGLSLVLAAPVIGHILPIFSGFRGGKGIAVTFGCLLGLFPFLSPVLCLAASFIFLSVGLRISPHSYRTIAAYLNTVILLLLFKTPAAVCAGFLLIAGAVCVRIYFSKEEKERFVIKVLWKR